MICARPLLNQRTASAEKTSQSGALWAALEPETLEREYLTYYNAMRKSNKKTA